MWTDSQIPIRRITHGPKHHWFGYYDKLQVDPSGRYALAMEVNFEGRSPGPDDEIRVGMVDLNDGDHWIELGRSLAWCWQQGCMLQWIPGSKRTAVWNDREGGRFVSRLLDVLSGQERTLPLAVYTLSPDGRTALSTDFRRLNDVRPGYGYAGCTDPFAENPAPRESGIWSMDLETGEHRLLLSLAQIRELPLPRSVAPSRNPLKGALRPVAERLGLRGPRPDLLFRRAKHWFNHILFAPDGGRFVFLNRWRFPGTTGFLTRMLTANLDGGDIRVVDDYGLTSHFIWRDPQTLLAWSGHPSYGNAFYLYPDMNTEVFPEPVGLGVMTSNGHCTYLPGGRWILNDTYPLAEERMQQLYAYDTLSERRVELGAFHNPPAYCGEWRCDLHPRATPDGRRVLIDSAHEGLGRQIYLIEIGGAPAAAGVPAQ
jgi:hypothetical protein